VASNEHMVDVLRSIGDLAAAIARGPVDAVTDLGLIEALHAIHHIAVKATQHYGGLHLDPISESVLGRSEIPSTS
jgi:hypothetical protein